MIEIQKKEVTMYGSFQDFMKDQYQWILKSQQDFVEFVTQDLERKENEVELILPDEFK